jgi:Protein of unknown function (DUF2510)
MQGWLYLVVIGFAIWVLVDASRLGARRGALGGGFLDMGPAAWFFACLLFWIVAIPCYLATRRRLVRRAHALATHQQFATTAHPQFATTAHAHVGSPPVSAGGYAHTPDSTPGWYTFPDGLGQRWWDGANWTDHNA